MKNINQIFVKSLSERCVNLSTPSGSFRFVWPMCTICSILSLLKFYQPLHLFQNVIHLYANVADKGQKFQRTPDVNNVNPQCEPCQPILLLVLCDPILSNTRLSPRTVFEPTVSASTCLSNYEIPIIQPQSWETTINNRWNGDGAGKRVQKRVHMYTTRTQQYVSRVCPDSINVDS